jgi:Calcineurin-like phosphoesterase
MSEASQSLIRPMFDGPVDVVADVHGEIEALRDLLGHLGYDEVGRHPEGRRLVFLGDLVDRGPNTPAVLQLVRGMIKNGYAQCVMGNHELNILRKKFNRDNVWFHGEDAGNHDPKKPMPQERLDRALREETEAFLGSLPLALERDDLRAVHACWDDQSIDRLRDETDGHAFYVDEKDRIDAFWGRDGQKGSIKHELASQNDNPVKVVTSGFERQTDQPFEAGGKTRWLERDTWWDEYKGPVFCVFGHYWRTPVHGKEPGPQLFDGKRPFDALGPGYSTCIDYSVGGRWLERLGSGAPQNTRLAALRWPERTITLDNGDRIDVSTGSELEV